MAQDSKGETLEQTSKLVDKLLKDSPEYMKFTKKEVERIAKGEKLKFAEGVEGGSFPNQVANVIGNHQKYLFNDKMMVEYGKFLLSATRMIDGGSCVGTKPISEFYCHECIARDPTGFCLCEKVVEAVTYRQNTQWIERSRVAGQSAFIAKDLLTISKAFRNSDEAQLAQLIGSIKQKSAKDIVKNLPHDILSDIELKHEYLMVLMGRAALQVILGQPFNPGELMSEILDGIKAIGVSRQVLGAVKELPMSARNGIAFNSATGTSRYDETKVPAYITRMMEYAIQSSHLADQFRPQKFFLVGACGGAGFEMAPLSMENIKAPMLPVVDLKGMAAVGKLVAGKGSSQAIMGGNGTPVDSPGTFTDMMGGKMPGGIGGQVMQQQIGSLMGTSGGKNQGLGNLAALASLSGLVKFLPRSGGFNPLLDNHSRSLFIPNTDAIIGSNKLNFEFMPYLDGRLLDSVPGVMTLLKQPFLCEHLNAQNDDLKKALNITSSNSKAQNSILSAMAMINPALGKEFGTAFKQIYQPLTGMGFKPPCLAYGMGQGANVSARTTSNKVASSLIKSILDTSPTSRLTTVASVGPTGLKVGSPTYYDTILHLAGTPKAKKQNDFYSVFNYGHTSRFDENPRPKKALLPKDCMDPEQPEPVLGDLKQTQSDRDIGDVTSEWTPFLMCSSGDPLNPDSEELAAFAWQIVAAMGAKPLWHENYGG